MTPREKISLVLFVLCILLVFCLEVFVLSKALVRILRGRPAGRLLLAKPALFLHLLTGIVVVCLLYGFFIEPNWIDTNIVTIRTPKLKEAAFRIVQISDLHCDTAPRNEDRAIEIISQLDPDVIVATGDYLNHPSAVPLLRDTLRRLRAPFGVYAVTGNFESTCWTDFDLFAWTDVHLLGQNTVTLTRGDDRISISGLSFDRAGACWDLLRELPQERFNVFLFHTPDLIEDATSFPVDLYLCGHTHGGQVALPLYGALITLSKFGKKYESGMYHVGQTVLYVNRGLGLEPRPAPRARFLARPEITVFDIVPAR
jgi:predicted MPP superfamily phosphohydrolase